MVSFYPQYSLSFSLYTTGVVNVVLYCVLFADSSKFNVKRLDPRSGDLESALVFASEILGFLSNAKRLKYS